MQKSGIFIFFCSLLGFQLAVAHPQHDFMRKFQSKKIEFPDNAEEFKLSNPGRYPAVLNWLFQSALSWNPTGKRHGYSQNCSPVDVNQNLRNERLVNSAYHKVVYLSGYFQVCRSELETGVSSQFMNSLKMMTMEFDPSHHPFLHVVKFHLPNGVILKGLLALHGDTKKRPMIVIRNGIFSNIEEFEPERYLLMQLFEQGPANVLVVENMTSADFVADNKKFSLGGFEEGQQNILLAQILQDQREPLAKIIQSVSMVGVSLGGNGVLMAAELNNVNSVSTHPRPLIDQFLAICPVVDLKTTFEQTLKESLQGTFMDFWAAQRLAGLRSQDPRLEKNFWLDWLRFKPKFFNTVLEKVEHDFDGGLTKSDQVIYPSEMKKSYFWGANSVLEHLDRINRPVLVMATVEDRLVPFEFNAARLDARFGKDKKNVGNYDVLGLENGMHCTLPIAYQWDAIADILNGVLNTEQLLKSTQEPIEIEIEGETVDESILHPAKVSFDVGWPQQDRFAILKIHIDGKNQKEITFNFSLELTDFEFRNPELTSSEKRMIERWLNRNLNLRMYKKGRKTILGLFLRNR